MEKKFSLEGVSYAIAFKLVADEINRLQEEIDKLKSKPRQAVASGGNCDQWCSYIGYSHHIPGCSRKGPV